MAKKEAPPSIARNRGNKSGCVGVGPYYSMGDRVPCRRDDPSSRNGISQLERIFFNDSPGPTNEELKTCYEQATMDPHPPQLSN